VRPALELGDKHCLLLLEVDSKEAVCMLFTTKIRSRNWHVSCGKVLCHSFHDVWSP